MATPPHTNRHTPARDAGLSPSAPGADASQSPPPNRAGVPGRPFADPALLTPNERLAAFGRLFARAVERRRARRSRTHSNKHESRQKRN
jgi:hypothetical protein